MRVARAIAALREAAEMLDGRSPSVGEYRRLREQQPERRWPADGSIRNWLGGGWNQGDSEWTASGRVCDFDGNCANEFECRSRTGQVEIYLPSGSSASGNEGWSWREDVGGRC